MIRFLICTQLCFKYKQKILFAVFALTEEQSDKVKGWHMESGDGIEITAPDKCCRARLLVEQDSVTFVDPPVNERITLFYND